MTPLPVTPGQRWRHRRTGTTATVNVRGNLIDPWWFVTFSATKGACWISERQLRRLYRLLPEPGPRCRDCGRYVQRPHISAAYQPPDGYRCDPCAFSWLAASFSPTVPAKKSERRPLHGTGTRV